MLLQLATTKFCFVTMFEVGGNTANNAFPPMIASKLNGTDFVRKPPLPLRRSLQVPEPWSPRTELSLGYSVLCRLNQPIAR